VSPRGSAFLMLAGRYDGEEPLRRIFEIMFSEEEARMFLHLPATPAEVARRCAVTPGDARRALDHGHRSGVLLTRRVRGGTRYALIHSRNLEESVLCDERNNSLGPAFFDSWKARASSERARLAACGPPAGDRGRRILPVEPHGHSHDIVIPLDDAESIVRNAGVRAAGQCSCRAAVQACAKPRDSICLAFDHAAETFLVRGAMRKLTAKQARSVLLRGAEEGLVHMTSGLFHEGAPTGVEFLCNCCTCCCNLLHPYLASGRTIPIGRNYLAAVDPDICDGCGECATRCPFGAALIASDVACVQGDLCLGCGQCAFVCPADAIRLERRAGPLYEPDRTHEHWVGPMEPPDQTCR